MAIYTKYIVDALEGEDIKSVLEIGSGESQNLRAIQERFPHIAVTGWDKNGNRDYPKMNIPYCDITKDMTQLCKEGEFDCVLVAATLILIGDEDMPQAVRNILHCAKRLVVLMEVHEPGFSQPQVGTSEKSRFRRDYLKWFPGLRSDVVPVVGWSSPGYEGSLIKLWKQ